MKVNRKNKLKLGKYYDDSEFTPQNHFSASIPPEFMRKNS